MPSVATVDDRGWQAIAWGVAAVVAVLLGARLLGSSPAPPPVRVAGPDAKSERHAGSGQSAGVYVHVAGAVRRPGLYKLAESARVAVALERAGGPAGRADLTAVNLAAKVQDGQQIVVPERGAASAGSTGTGSQGAVGDTGVPVSLGTATVEQLEQLDGIGPTLATRIVEHRQASGGLSSLDQLAEVDGIGEQRLEALKQALSP